MDNITELRDKLPVNPDPKRIPQTRKLSDITALVLHCTDWDTDAMTIAKYDVTPNKKHHISKLGCPTFTYHYYIEKNGEIQRCVDVSKVTWHVGIHNEYTVGVSMRYVSTKNKDAPPSEQLNAACFLLRDLCLWLNISPNNIKGHRELYDTGYKIINGQKVLRKECPGLLVNMDTVRYNVSCLVQTTLFDKGFYVGKIDGHFGPNSNKALQEYTRVRKAGKE